MPGREHFIPQFFMSAWTGQGGQDRVYQFRRGRPGFPSGIRDTAVVGDFYGEGADSVDWMFTQREGDQATLVRELRAGASTDDRKAKIDEFITLMTARSRNIRLGFSDLGQRTFDIVGWALGSEEGRRALIEMILKRGAKILADKGMAVGSPGFDLGMMVMRSAVAPLVQTGVVDQFYAAFRAAFRAHLGDVGSLMGNAHVNALRRLSAEPVINRMGLAELRWRVEAVPDSLILGDVGPMARFGDKDALAPLYQGGPSVKAVFYPLSPRELLVGSPDGSIVVIPSADELNVAMAETSGEFFIADQSTDREAGYAARLGLRPPALDDDSMRRAMLEELAGLE